MEEQSTITALLGQMKENDSGTVAQAIWQRYFDRLARLARNKIKERQRRVVDEEDIALSALDSFFRGVSNGRFSELKNSDDLWQVLVMLTERKAIDQIRKHTAAKRGGGLVRGDSAFVKLTDSGMLDGMDQVPGAEPTPEFALYFSETYQEMLAALNDAELVQVALFKMEGLTNKEIAEKLGRLERSVERKLHTIRKIWATQE